MLTSQRLDSWLYAVRLCKTRTRAAAFISEEGVRINRRKVFRPSALVRVVDVLTISLHGQVRIIEVTGLSLKRVSASVAQGLRRDLLTEDAPFQNGGNVPRSQHMGENEV